MLAGSEGNRKKVSQCFLISPLHLGELFEDGNSHLWLWMEKERGEEVELMQSNLNSFVWLSLRQEANVCRKRVWKSHVCRNVNESDCELFCVGGNYLTWTFLFSIFSPFSTLEGDERVTSSQDHKIPTPKDTYCAASGFDYDRSFCRATPHRAVDTQWNLSPAACQHGRSPRRSCRWLALWKEEWGRMMINNKIVKLYLN